MKKTVSALMIFSIMTMILSGCASKNGSKSQSIETVLGTTAGPVISSEEQPEEVIMTLAAAASLENVFAGQLIPMFCDKYPWIVVEGIYDSSGKLQTQIEEGLAADVFFSAASKQMTALADSGRIDKGTVTELLENEIVLIAPVDSDTVIDSFEKIGEAKTIAIGDPESVPAGQYAAEALKNIQVWEQIQSKVSLATNVTEVLNQVAEASADVGIVYATNAAQMLDKVKVLATAPEGSLEKKVFYPVGILTEAHERKAAELFMDFLQSPEAMQAFTENGFKANFQ